MLKSAAVIFVFITLGKSFNVKDYHLLLAVGCCWRYFMMILVFNLFGIIFLGGSLMSPVFIILHQLIFYSEASDLCKTCHRKF